MAVGAVVCFVWERTSYNLTYVFFKSFTKGGDDA
jgi:hypothetical protein